VATWRHQRKQRCCIGGVGGRRRWNGWAGKGVGGAPIARHAGAAKTSPPAALRAASRKSAAPRACAGRRASRTASRARGGIAARTVYHACLVPRGAARTSGAASARRRQNVDKRGICAGIFRRRRREMVRRRRRRISNETAALAAQRLLAAGDSNKAIKTLRKMAAALRAPQANRIIGMA